MIIKPALGQEIVSKLKDVIDQDINFMNEEGYIISSTNPERINSYHQASKICIKTKEMVVIEYDDQYIGSKKGINVPVKLENKVIGVIGISGSLDEVEKYGSIIGKMTEILLREQRIKENQNTQLERTRNLIESLIYNKIEYHKFLPSNVFEMRKYICCAKIKNIYSIDKTQFLNFLINKGDRDNIFVTIIHDEIIILYLGTDKDNLNNYLNILLKEVIKRFDINLVFGISSNFISLKNSHRFYYQALDALKWQRIMKPELNIIFHDDMDIGLLITDIEDKKLYEYSYKILKNIEEKDLPSFKDLLTAYGIYNGSIARLSEHFYMHKNTIQYKLNKLYHLTGHNPRELNGYMVLRLAFLGVE